MQSAPRGASVAAGVGRAAALAVAGLLLCNQIIAALEYTSGGSLYARTSAVSVMIALAALPACFQFAMRMGDRITALGLALAFTAFLVYALPATIGRTAEPRTQAAAALEDAQRGLALKREAHDRALAAADAVGAELKSCGGASVRGCKRLAQMLENANLRLDDTRATLQNHARPLGGSAAGDMGSDVIALWTGLHPDAVRRASVVAYAAGVELGVGALIALALRRGARAGSAEVSNTVVPAPARPSGANAATEWLRTYLDGVQGPLSHPDIYAEYCREWGSRGKRCMSSENFAKILERETKRSGLVCRQVGRRKLYAVAA